MNLEQLELLVGTDKSVQVKGRMSRVEPRTFADKPKALRQQTGKLTGAAHAISEGLAIESAFPAGL